MCRGDACVAQFPHERKRATQASPLQYLAAIGVFFFAVTAVTSFFAKVQVNWPAPAYFTLMILTAHFIATRLQVSRDGVRPPQ